MWQGMVLRLFKKCMSGLLVNKYIKLMEMVFQETDL